ncbi:MAG: fatty acid--CoA ligase family protein [Nocardioides sp.]|nr:fatty acid--CoA ligase family protein [Nocardioides sp.]
MIELLRRVAVEDPARVAIVTHDRSVTYADLLASAEAAASELVADEVTRFAALSHQADVMIALLAGASSVGVEMCQYPPVSEAEVAELAWRFDHDLIIDEPRSSPRWADGEGRAGADAADPVHRPDRPHLVLTTGTTGAPRGVRHDWSRLLRSTRRVRPAPGQRWLLAYGLHQFAGLQVLLHVFAAGATLVAPAPRRPVEGLAAMRGLGVTHASATPTYWRFLLAELRADGGPTPELQQITLGGEAIPAPLLSQIRTAFPDAEVSQVYAASEFGATGSVRDRRSGLSTEVLARGEDADVAMKVVDGELWVRSRIGMLGYYGEDPVDADAWRPTGDLVEMTDDRILFRGRSSEIVNVGGVKVHPLPIEERVGAVAGVDMARAFGRPNPMTGSIVAVEIVPVPGADIDQIKTAVREACKDLDAAARPRSIRFVDHVTTSGDKIIRRAQ